MLPEVEWLMMALVVIVPLVALVLWLGTIFQNVLFQRYRLYKNEAAKRKTRLHEQQGVRDGYRKELMGEVQETVSE